MIYNTHCYKIINVIVLIICTDLKKNVALLFSRVDLAERFLSISYYDSVSGPVSFSVKMNFSRTINCCQEPHISIEL